jgi:hypothetical protein
LAFQTSEKKKQEKRGFKSSKEEPRDLVKEGEMEEKVRKFQRVGGGR